MRLREVIDSPCGLRYMFEALDLRSGVARRAMLDSHMMTSAGDIRAAYAKLADFTRASRQEKQGRELRNILSGLKDIAGTLARLAAGDTLDDVALFEIKELSIFNERAATELSVAGISAVELPVLHGVLAVLDPDSQRIPSFHIYESYSPRLAELRRLIRAEGDAGEREILTLRSLEEEERVRKELSARLRPFAGVLGVALAGLIETDVLLAKAGQIGDMELCFPEVVGSGVTKYEGMFHPQTKSFLAAEGKDFQPVDIVFGGRPTTIIGANMGGKTVVLKMAALNQYLFQFGFGIPASSASIDIKEDIKLYIGEEEPQKGLSSFGAEIVRINAMIASARAGVNGLALVDEPARTTNPVEGTALVSALVEVMASLAGDLMITTHYNLTDEVSRRLRVKGLKEGKMDYRLVEVSGSEVPHEAITIARSLEADTEWIEKAKEILEE